MSEVISNVKSSSPDYLSCPFCLRIFRSSYSFNRHLRGVLVGGEETQSPGMGWPLCAELRKLYPEGLMTFSEYRQIRNDAYKANNRTPSKRQQSRYSNNRNQAGSPLKTRSVRLEKCLFCSKEMDERWLPRHFRGYPNASINANGNLATCCVRLRKLYPQGLPILEYRKLMADFLKRMNESDGNNNNNGVNHYNDKRETQNIFLNGCSTLIEEKQSRSGIKCPFCLHVLSENSLKQHIRGMKTGCKDLSRPFCKELQKRHPQGLRFSTFKKIYAEIVDDMVAESDGNVAKISRPVSKGRGNGRRATILKCPFCLKSFGKTVMRGHLRGRLNYPNCVELRKLYPQGVTVSEFKQIYELVRDKAAQRDEGCNSKDESTLIQKKEGSEIVVPASDDSVKLSHRVNNEGLVIADQGSNRRLGADRPEFPLPETVCESCGIMTHLEATLCMPCCLLQRTCFHCIVLGAKNGILRCGRCGTDLLPTSTV